MKYVLSFIALILCLSVSLPTLCISQNINVKQEKKLSKKERKALRAAAMEADVASAFEKKRILVEINRIYPSGRESRVTNNSYAFRLVNDSLTCHLPYIGDMTTSAYGGIDLSINASGTKVINPQYLYDQEQNCYFILFKFINETRNERWDCKIQLFKDKIVYIGLSCLNRSSISYEGELAAIK